MSSGGPACPYETRGISMFRFGLYQAVVRRSIRGPFSRGIGPKIFSQIIANGKFGAVCGRLTLPNPSAIKTLRALHMACSRLCEGAYSAVAQWQSIRLLTEGL